MLSPFQKSQIALLHACIAPPKTSAMDRDAAVDELLASCIGAVADFIRSQVGPGQRWSSQSELAEASGITRSTFKRLVTGKLGSGFTLEPIVRLALTTGVSVSTVLGHRDGLTPGNYLIDTGLEKVMAQASAYGDIPISFVDPSGMLTLGQKIPAEREEVDGDEFARRLIPFQSKSEHLRNVHASTRKGEDSDS